jgi:aminoacrylate peracid reductase
LGLTEEHSFRKRVFLKKNSQDGRRCYIMKSEIIIPKGWQKPPAPYSPGVKKGNMVFTAGQVARNEKGELVGKGDIKVQTRQVLENVRACLEAAGAIMEDVVMAHVFLAHASNFGEMNEVYQEYFPEDFPARACVIAGLVKEEFLVEICVIAVTG